MPRRRASEVDAYTFIKKDLQEIGWVTSNPLRSKRGQVYTQVECLDDPRIQEQLGQCHPENVVKLSDTEFYIIEAKSRRLNIKQALKEAREDYADKINQSGSIRARIISGLAGNDTEGYLVQSEFRVGGEWKPIILNGRGLSGLVSPLIAEYLIHHDTNAIEDLPVNEEVFFESASRI